MLLALHNHQPSNSLARVAGRASGLATTIMSWPARLARQRELMARMAAMSDYELADIGLNRHDVSDATAVAPGDDPSALLALRARERRNSGTRR